MVLVFSVGESLSEQIAFAAHLLIIALYMAVACVAAGLFMRRSDGLVAIAFKKAIELRQLAVGGDPRQQRMLAAASLSLGTGGGGGGGGGGGSNSLPASQRPLLPQSSSAASARRSITNWRGVGGGAAAVGEGGDDDLPTSSGSAGFSMKDRGLGGGHATRGTNHHNRHVNQSSSALPLSGPSRAAFHNAGGSTVNSRHAFGPAVALSNSTHGMATAPNGSNAAFAPSAPSAASFHLNSAQPTAPYLGPSQGQGHANAHASSSLPTSAIGRSSNAARRVINQYAASVQFNKTPQQQQQQQQWAGGGQNNNNISNNFFPSTNNSAANLRAAAGPLPPRRDDHPLRRSAGGAVPFSPIPSTLQPSVASPHPNVLGTLPAAADRKLSPPPPMREAAGATSALLPPVSALSPCANAYQTPSRGAEGGLTTTQSSSADVNAPTDENVDNDDDEGGNEATRRETRLSLADSSAAPPSSIRFVTGSSLSPPPALPPFRTTFHQQQSDGVADAGGGDSIVAVDVNESCGEGGDSSVPQQLLMASCGRDDHDDSLCPASVLICAGTDDDATAKKTNINKKGGRGRASRVPRSGETLLNERRNVAVRKSVIAAADEMDLAAGINASPRDSSSSPEGNYCKAVDSSSSDDFSDDDTSPRCSASDEGSDEEAAERGVVPRGGGQRGGGAAVAVGPLTRSAASGRRPAYSPTASYYQHHQQQRHHRSGPTNMVSSKAFVTTAHSRPTFVGGGGDGSSRGSSAAVSRTQSWGGGSSNGHVGPSAGGPRQRYWGRLPANGEDDDITATAPRLGFPANIDVGFEVPPSLFLNDSSCRFLLFIAFSLSLRASFNLAMVLLQHRSIFIYSQDFVTEDGRSLFGEPDRGRCEQNQFLALPSFLFYCAPLVLLHTFASIIARVGRSGSIAQHVVAAATGLFCLVWWVSVGLMTFFDYADLLEHVGMCVSAAYAAAYVGAFFYFPHQLRHYGREVHGTVLRIRSTAAVIATFFLWRAIVIAPRVQDAMVEAMTLPWYMVGYMLSDLIPVVLTIVFLHARADAARSSVAIAAAQYLRRLRRSAEAVGAGGGAGEALHVGPAGGDGVSSAPYVHYDPHTHAPQSALCMCHPSQHGQYNQHHQQQLLMGHGNGPSSSSSVGAAAGRPRWVGPSHGVGGTVSLPSSLRDSNVGGGGGAPKRRIPHRDDGGAAGVANLSVTTAHSMAPVWGDGADGEGSDGSGRASTNNTQASIEAGPQRQQPPEGGQAADNDDGGQ